MNLSGAEYAGDVDAVKRALEAGEDVNPNSPLLPLNTAVGMGHEAIALLLIKAGADVNKPPGFPPLVTACCKKGVLNLVNALLAAGANVNATANFITDNRSKITPLMEAAKNGHTEIVRELLGAGADVRLRDGGSNRTAREWAQEGGHTDAVALLTEAERETTFSATEQLIAAAKSGDCAALKSVLEKCSNPDHCECVPSGMTALMFAARHGHAEAIKLLVAAGANVNATTDPANNDQARARSSYSLGGERFVNCRLARTALMNAAEYNQPEALRLLLYAGAQVNAADHLGLTALMLAARKGHFECVKDLLEAHADTEKSDLDGTTALLLATNAIHIPVVTMLLAAGAKPDAKNKHKSFPLQAALKTGNSELTNPLLRKFLADRPKLTKTDRKTLGLLIATVAKATREYQVDDSSPPAPNAKGRAFYSQTGTTHESRLLPDAEVQVLAQLLIDAGAEINAQDPRDGTPLMICAGEGHIALAELLLRYGADINAQHAKSGETALFTAIRTPRLPVLEFLLQHKADPNIPNDSGETPLLKAEKWKQAREILIKYGAKLEVKETPRLAVARRKEGEERAKRLAKNDKKWGPETPKLDFSAAGSSAKFHAAVAKLAERCGNPCVPVAAAPGLYRCDVRSTRTVELEKLHREFIGDGCYLFQRDATDATALMLAPTADRYAVIAALQTNGQNYDVGPGGIIEFLKELETEQPFILLGAGNDFITGRFLTALKKPAALAKKLYEFCPDVVDQGCGDVKALADELKKSHSLYLWWD